MQILNNLNYLQKLTIGCAAAVLIVLFFLHNPLSGYTTTYLYSYPKILEPCSPNDKEKYRQFLISFYRSDLGKEPKKIAEASLRLEREIERKIQNCHLLGPGLPTDSNLESESLEKNLPFDQWSSVNPLIEWLRPLVNFIYGVLITISISTVFVGFVFKQRSHD